MEPRTETGDVPAVRSSLRLLNFVAIVAALGLAKAILIPIALAILLSFILAPAVKRLERRGVNRAAALALVLLLAIGASGGFGYVVVAQVVDLSARVTEYSGSIKAKLSSIKHTGAGVVRNIEKTAELVRDAIEEKQLTAPVAYVGPKPPSAVERLLSSVAPVAKPFGTLLVVLVLVAFMLGHREELRNRLIRLGGRGRVSLTTRTLDEGGHRISQFLVTQLAISSALGVLLTIGLTVIGVPYAVLWGSLTVLLRFVPFVGSAIAMLQPALLAFAIFPGWQETLATIGLFLALDLIAAYLVEPLVIGKRTGVSSIALLVSALFWTWLWGPIGLLLATPITVCLAVLGKFVPELEYLGVLLSDEPALETDVVLYQRLVSGDEDDAYDIFERQLVARPLAEVLDGALLPALSLADRDRQRHAISDAEHDFVLRAIRGMVERADRAEAERAPSEASEAATPAVPSGARWKVVAVATRSLSDDLAVEMLARLFEDQCEVSPVASSSLAGELVALVETAEPDMVCVVSMPPGGLARAGYTCKRVRRAFATARILVLRPGVSASTADDAAKLRESGADAVVTSLVDALAFVESRAPLVPMSPPVMRVEPELAAATGT